MNCQVILNYIENGISKTYPISVLNGDFIGEWIPDGGGFSPCPSVVQAIVRARNPNTGEIIGQIRTTTCNTLIYTGYTNTCPPTTVKYDCINGACVSKATYNTPGIYNSLSECEVACGTGCNGKCISNADWAQIEGLANQLKNQTCS